MTDPTERLEYFATNDTAHGGDLLTPADFEEGIVDLVGPDIGSAILQAIDDTADVIDMDGLPDPALQDVFAYLRAVKRFGLALQQLGRRCDE